MPTKVITGKNTVYTRNLGLIDYLEAWHAMQSFTNQRHENTSDEFWCLQHPAVFTQGQAGKPEHILNAGDIPVIQTDRGGQVTYHGPGQCVVYLLADIRRMGLGVRSFVSKIEQSVIDLLADYHIKAANDPKAPGVYVDGAKICSLGLRIRRGMSFHGLSLNVDMDLSPFQQINPCGVANLPVVQMHDFIVDLNYNEVQQRLIRHLCHHLDYSHTALSEF